MEDKKLYSPRVIKDIMEKYKFNFSKRLGQNFLIDKNIIDKICDNSDISMEDGIIEIGPGIGVLSYELCKRAKKVVLIELDKTLIPVLEENLLEYNNFNLIQGDILKIDLKKLIEEEFKSKGINRVKIVANLPYYITTPIIMKLLEEQLDIEKIVVMVQKEVAERLISKPGKKDYGAITLAVNYYSKVEIIANVPNTMFMPRPKVDSAVIMLEVEAEKEVKNKELLFKVIKASFGQRRKTILNAISSSDIEVDKEGLKEILDQNNIDGKRRGETFSLEEFIELSDIIDKN